MSSALYTINQAQLRRDGRRLKRLAATGQIMLLVVLLAIPLILYAIAHPAMPGVGFGTFFKQLLITGPYALVNLYELIKGIALFVALDRTRCLGHALTSKNPLGSDTLDQLRWLGYSLCAFTLVLCVTIERVPSTMISVDMASSALIEPKLKIGASITPIYFGAMALIGLSIARRVVSEAVSLKTETQEFI
jgi:hypothetical protein